MKKETQEKRTLERQERQRLVRLHRDLTLQKAEISEEEACWNDEKVE